MTEKERDTVPILRSIMSFGAKWCAEEVFEDHRARTMKEIYPGYCEAEKRKPE
jgi:hypothetical protein